MAECVFCGNQMTDETLTVKITQRGCEGIHRASQQRNADLTVVPGQVVHAECRKKFTNPKRIAQNKKQQQAGIVGCKRRSSAPSFSYKDHCLFCGVHDRYAGKKKKFKLIPVRTTDFQTKISEICTKRRDHWSDVVKGRLAYVNDLHAADAVYHQVCSINFRTGKQVPECFHDEDNNGPKRCKIGKVGRPKSDAVADKQADRNLIMAAAELLKSDIRSVVDEKGTYPTSLEMSSVMKTLLYLPESLKLFLRTLFIGKNKDLKVSSLGQAIMQATRPRGLLPPLQLGVGIQMHHHFASKFLVDTLHQLGFSCSYSEVQKFERSAAVAQKTEVDGFTPGHFIQYVADNADHNTRTIDGHGTFHGMGIIACITPRIERASVIPPVKITAKDLEKVGHINIVPYVQKSGGLKTLTYQEVEEHSEDDREMASDRDEREMAADTLWKLSLLLGKCPRPGWSGMMQMLNTGKDHPGQSEVIFLPMIDMNPGDLTCIYSTLEFINNQATHYQVTPILTFDQPLWWKAMTIIENEASGSPLKSIVLRLGGFHVLMSFLGAIGHLMAGSGLEEILKLVYASNAVTKMLEGKAVSRAIRGHFLVDGALNTLLAAKTFEVKLPIPASCAVDPKELTKDDTVADDYEGRKTAAHEPVSYQSDGESTDHAEGLTEYDSDPGESEDTQSETDLDESVSDQSDGESTDHAEDLTEYGSDFSESEDTQRETHLDGPASNQQDKESTDHGTDLPDALAEASDLYDSIMAGTTTRTNASELKDIAERLEAEKTTMVDDRTAALWLQYMEMLDLVRAFIKSERTGNWNQHLDTLTNMMPFMAASGHNLYVKSLSIYLQKMHQLEKTHPQVYERFQDDGLQVVRRSNEYWAGLSPDLVIEQALMRSMKTTGGLTRGRGMTETQRAVWVLSNPATSEINAAMQELTRVNYETSAQHKDLSSSRQLKDTADTIKILSFLESFNPFHRYEHLQHLITGETAHNGVNVDRSKEIGKSILKDMGGRHVNEYVFKKKAQAVTMVSKSTVKLHPN